MAIDANIQDNGVQSISGSKLNSVLTHMNEAARQEVERKQEKLVDGKTIKTINGKSILGEGNINIQGGGGESVEEIYIGEEEPTDENVKVWINPNEKGEIGGNGENTIGGGEEVLTLQYIPQALHEFFFQDNFVSPDAWEEVKSAFEAELSGFSTSPIALAIDGMFVHNAKVVQKLRECAKEGKGTFLLLDESAIDKAYTEFEFAMGELTGATYNVSLAFISEVEVLEYDIPGEYSVTEIIVSPISNKRYEYHFAENGAYSFTLSSRDHYSLYVPEEGVALDSYYIQENLNIYKDGYEAIGQKFQIWNMYEGGSQGSGGMHLISQVDQFNGFSYFDGLELKKCTLGADGIPSISVIGRLTE